MIFQPSILALLTGSLLISSMLLYACVYGVKILKHWDIRSGSELQLELERRTYLVSTLMAYAFGFQLISFFLFIYTVDHLHTFFVGAMCAAGSLNVNGWGYPAILLKIANVLLAGLWLMMNFADNKAYDYPLIKKKYLLLLLAAPFLLADTLVQGGYFLGLKPNIITSCCGTLFSTDAPGFSSELASLPLIPMEAAFFSSMAVTLGAGLFFALKGKGGYLFSLSSLITFLISVASFISFISLYFYELPTHHCPFCVLQKEYDYVGYPIYFTLFGGVLPGLGVGLLMPFRRIESLKDILPAVQRRFASFSIVSYGCFGLLSVFEMVHSNLVL